MAHWSRPTVRCMPRWFLCTVAFAALLYTGAPLDAQQPMGSVLVRVLNGQRGEPLPFAQASVRDTQIGAVTNSQGEALLLNVPSGERTLIVQLIGYGELRRSVTVTAGATVSVLFEMYPRAVELEGVVVTGTAIAARRREIGNSIALITSEQI